MSDPNDPPRTVVRLEVDSYKRMRAAHVIPSPTGLVPVRGRNAQGKSSLIESMMAALCGRTGKSDLPITEGAHGAEVVVDLGDIIVTRKWTRDSGGRAKTALVVADAKTGRKKAGPQAVLDALTGRFADPVAFLALSPMDQVKTVLGVLGLDDELASFEEDAKAYYEDRRDVGRDVDRLGKALHEIDIEIDGLPSPPENGTIQELTAELQAADSHNRILWEYGATKLDSEERGKQAKERLGRLKEEVAKLESEIQVQRDRWDAAAESLKGASEIDAEPIKARLADHE